MCPNKVPRGKCAAHQRAYEAQRERAKPWRQWYRQQPWLSLRLQVLEEQPWCVLCEAAGRPFVPATAVDHERPHNGNWELFVERKNLRGVCASCNADKANTTDRGRTSRRFR
jgi:5-methylcytosine-specific restriction protein A